MSGPQRPQEEVIFDHQQVQEMLEELAGRLADRRRECGDLALMGIRTGGAHLAKRLQGYLEGTTGTAPDTGIMDITLYRDDWTLSHSRPKVGRTEIPFSIEDRVVVLVDDVLYTGRTVRAALDALIDFGRPRRIELLVLVDRGHRELPIQPDYVGAVVETSEDQIIDVLLKEEGHPRDQVLKKSRPRRP